MVGSYQAVTNGGQGGLGRTFIPGPCVPEPQRRQQVDRRGVGPAVVRRHEHQDVVRGGLGVLDQHIEIAIVVERAGVQELVFHVLLAPATVRRHQIQVGESSLGILVLALEVRVGRCAVQVEPVLLDILAVVALPVGESEHPLLEDRIGAVPERQSQAQLLALVRHPRDAVLAPAVGARPGLVVGEVVPGVATL